jgi:methylase of polypeptide subunit release factors
MTFGPLEIRFDERVLRPRPWTLAQSEWAVELAAEVPSGPVVELCAGVGHIGLAVAAELDRRVVLVDADEHACELARLNVDAAGLDDRVEVRAGRLDAALADDERFALALADPPWVRSDATGRFPEDPLTAIDGGDDGLEVARACVEVIARHLLPGGVGILQIGDEAQAAVVAEELDARPEVGLRVADVRVPPANGVLVLLRHR